MGLDTLRRAVYNERGHLNAQPDGPILQEYASLPPAVEEVLHHAGIEVKKIPLGPQPEDGEAILLRFHTPAKIYTVKLDQGGANMLINALRGTDGTPDIVIARPGDIPGLRSG